MKKKIAVIIPKYGLVGGGEKYAFEITERLALNDGYAIHVFANKWSSHSNRITFHKVPICSFPKFLTTISFAYFANHRIAQMNFDLIHSHDRVFRADIFTMHGIPHEFWVNKVKKKRMSLFDRATAWVENMLVDSGTCSQYLAVSTLARQMFLEKYVNKVFSAQTTIVRPGVDVQRFDKRGKEDIRRKIRKQFNLKDTDKITLFVSMNFELKGLDLLLDVFSILKKKGYANMKLLVVGKGNQDKYKKLARMYGIEEIVTFTGVWRDNIEQAYWASDLLAMFSAFDTFGMTVLEAMAASLPVMISDNVGAKDIVKQAENGYVFSTLNPEEISERLLCMLRPENYAALSKNAEATAWQHTWDAAVKRMDSIYATLLNQNPHSMKGSS